MAEALALLAALAVFLAAYVAISLPGLERAVARRTERLPPRARRAARFAASRAGVAAIGGLAMLLVGAVALPDALRAIDLGTLAILLGMMLLVAGLECANFFAVLAAWLVRRFPTPRGLLVATMIATAVLSALVLNDAVVLLFTPVLVKAARGMGVDPVPFLVGEAVAANVGSVATPVGNPQNAHIAVAADFTFLEFARALAPVAAACLALAIVAALIAYRRPLATAHRQEALVEARVTNPAMLALALAGVALALTLFLAGRAVPLQLPAKALLAGALVALLAYPIARVPVTTLARKVEWGVLVFFAGLFVLIAGVRDSGLLARFYDALSPVALDTVSGLTIVTAALANLVSNVPAVVLLAPAVSALSDPTLWLALAATSTLAGNATLLGAAANVLVAESAKANGVELDYWRFVAFGLPVTLATLGIAVAMLR